ncbi:MAG: M56 family metallopeptidase, partial [Acidobacteriaceae bacterium]
AEVPVLSSSAAIEPGIFGVFRPVLLFPEGIPERLSAEQMRAIVAHEMCHVRRRDNLTFAIHMVVETLFWFHPMVWWIGSRLIEERERACDQAVVQAGSEAQVYAEGILNVCKFYVESPLACASA